MKYLHRICRKCRLLLFLWLAVTSPVHADPNELPDLGDPAESALSVAKEREIGREIMREIRQKRVIVDDLLSQEYISTLGHQLVAQADSAVHDFSFFILDEQGINAFALPGGYIGVNSGLITKTDNESELAAVLAHEISHVTQRHLARRFMHNEQFKGPMVAAMIAAILLGGEAAEAAVVAAQAGAVQSSINFTRKNEQEADRVGIHLLAKAGYDPDSMATLFEKMHQQARLHGGAPPEFLSTHPVHSSRIADARARAQRYKRAQQKDSVDYRVVRARLRVLLHSNPARVASDLRRLLEEGQTSDRVMERYAYAVALLKSGQAKPADAQSRELVKQHPEIMAFQLLQSEVDVALGNDEPALQRLRQQREKYPDHHVLTLEYARILIHTGRAHEAGKVLESHLVYRSGDPTMYALLSQAAKAGGDNTRSHVYMAEHYTLLGDLSLAISHLESALKGKIDDYYEEARLQSRLKRLRETRAEREKSGS